MSNTNRNNKGGQPVKDESDLEVHIPDPEDRAQQAAEALDRLVALSFEIKAQEEALKNTTALIKERWGGGGSGETTCTQIWQEPGVESRPRHPFKNALSHWGL